VLSLQGAPTHHPVAEPPNWEIVVNMMTMIDVDKIRIQTFMRWMRFEHTTPPMFVLGLHDFRTSWKLGSA